MQLDLLAFGPHPDDIEIGMAGIIARHVALGHSVGLCDLTRGELGTNGTPAERMAEAEAARETLGAAVRVNLGLPDGGLDDRSPEQVRAVAAIVRRLRPKVVALPYWSDRHPDHEAASELVRSGSFRAGLRRYGAEGDPWKPDWLCYYFINDAARPSFVVDVSDYYGVKRRALACHRSQFAPPAGQAAATRLTSPRFLQLIESRDAQFGALAGVQFAEGVVVREPILRGHLLKHDK
jgi:N-acetylglucosamine malate deacetylase 1